MTTTTQTKSTSFGEKVLSALAFIGIDSQAVNAVKSSAKDGQNIVSEGVTTGAYVIGSVTRSASTLATATRMGSEALYNALPSDREAVESKINELTALTLALASDINTDDTQVAEKPRKFGTKKVQEPSDIS